MAQASRSVAAPHGELLALLLAFLLANASIALPAHAGELTVLATTPARHALTAPRATTVAVQLDRAVNPATVSTTSFRVAGRFSGPVAGTFQLSDGNQRVTFVPERVFSAGEVVNVWLANSLAAADGSPLRAAGYAYAFTVAAGVGTRTFVEIDSVDVRTSPGSPTRAYGAFGMDLDQDGWIDLGVVNEDTADLRVLLNLGDGSGLYAPFIQPPAPLGPVASPNESADFDGDGLPDAASANAGDGTVSILLGDGDGTFGLEQSVAVGSDPHGLASLDADGDGDLDLVASNTGSNNLRLLTNDGAGVFAAGATFEGGGNGEYGIAAGDMDHDGIFDLVVGTQNDSQIHVLRGNGNGTFTLVESQSAGGATWMLALGDVDGDGDLDVASANGHSANGGLLRGDGAGNLAAPTTHATSGSTVATDLGDLDGDGDLDWVLSSFGGSRWHRYVNNGGTFSPDGEILAPDRASCATLYDFDNDLDLDLALVDEIADVVLLLRNLGGVVFTDGFEGGTTVAWSNGGG